MTRPAALRARVLARVTGLSGVLTVVAALLALLALVAPVVVHLGPVGAGTHLPWWALALMFGVVELCVLHVQVRREAHTVSLHEIPLVLGLFFASPAAVLLARLVGPVPVLLFHRRQSALKVVFNLALFLADAAVAIAVFRLFTLTSVTADAVAWLATFAAVIASGTVAATATTCVIAAHERSWAWRELWVQPLVDAPRSVAVATLALVAVYALSLDTAAAVPLLAAAGVVLVAYRAYANLSDRHLSLERLYRFSQAVSTQPEMESVLRSVLREAKELLRAETAHVLFLPPAEGPAAHVALTAADRLVRRETDELLQPGRVDAEVVRTATAQLVPRGTKDPAQRRLLDELQAREAVVVPLRGDAGVVGTVTVADRLGEVRTFDAADVRLLETVANHASIALQNGRLIDKLRYDALHDALTGLPNRVHLGRALNEALEAFQRGEAARVAVMIMDLDGFKEVNDTLGHHQGDALLREVAARLRVVAGDDAVVARLGGDEFAVLLPDVPDADAASARARRVVQALEQPIDLDGLEVGVGGSLGVALAPEHGQEGAVLLKRADVAMYAAKAGSEGVRLYQADLDTSNPQRLALVSDLRTAIELEQLELHVQPKARLDTGVVDGVEALLRWQHPVHGPVPPDEFIPVAERSGLIVPLTDLVLRTALQACATWRAAGHEVAVAVNLSARSLTDPALADDVAALLRRHDVPARLLTLEITEGSVMTDPAGTIALLLRLHGMGVRLSVDDFGTGYSSLSYLKRLPVHEVKIDKSFVTHVVEDADDATIVRSIIDMAGHLALDVVAEGVEDRAAWDRLGELGCTYAQGWYLSRPMPITDLLPWLTARAPGADALPPAVPRPRAEGAPAGDRPGAPAPQPRVRAPRSGPPGR